MHLQVLIQANGNPIRVQIIQTLSMLVANVSNELSLYYIFSGNHINNLIRYRFDWSDDEVTRQPTSQLPRRPMQAFLYYMVPPPPPPQHTTEVA